MQSCFARRELLQSTRLSQAGWTQRWLRQKPKRLEKGLAEDLEEAEVVVLPQQQGAQERAADSTAQLQSRSRWPVTQTASWTVRMRAPQSAPKHWALCHSYQAVQHW